MSRSLKISMDRHEQTVTPRSKSKNRKPSSVTIVPDITCRAVRQEDEVTSQPSQKKFGRRRDDSDFGTHHSSEKKRHRKKEEEELKNKANRRRVAMLSPGDLKNRREFIQLFPCEDSTLRIEETRVAEDFYEKLAGIQDSLKTTVAASRVDCANESYTRTFVSAIAPSKWHDVVFERSVASRHVDVAFSESPYIVELKGMRLTEQEIAEGLGQAVMYAAQVNAGPNLTRVGSFRGYVALIYTGHCAIRERDSCIYCIRLASYNVQNMQDDISISWEMEPVISSLIVNWDGTIDKDEFNEAFLQRFLFIHSQPFKTFESAEHEQKNERREDDEERRRKRRQEDCDEFYDA